LISYRPINKEGMGYMGFGMQSWIYRMRPRKPFSMERKKSFTSVPKTSRQFKLQRSKQSDKLYIIISFLLLSLFFGIAYIMKDSLLLHANTIEKEKNERIADMNEAAYKFLLNSGKSRLNRNNIMGAYSEFKLAYNLKPKETELKNLLIETVYILCNFDSKYCDELDKLQSDF
jgi:hypothetical protein